MAISVKEALQMIRGAPAFTKGGQPYEPWHEPLDVRDCDYRVIALGTSITWGAGLLFKHKTAVKTCAALHAAGKTPVLGMYAQSGAILWPAPSNGGLQGNRLRTFKELDDVHLPANATRRLTEPVGEVPARAPYIWEQARAAADDLERLDVDADLVLIEMGANDIQFVKSVLEKSASTGECSQYLLACEKNLVRSCRDLLKALRAHPRFQNAPILWHGYYRAITTQTNHTAFRAHPFITPLLKFLQAFSSVSTALLDDWVANMDRFANITDSLGRAAVAAAKDPLAKTLFLDSAFGPEHGAFAPQQAVWPAASSPWDEALAIRLGASGGGLAAAIDAEVGAVFHPNVLGAELNAAVQVRALRDLALL